MQEERQNFVYGNVEEGVEGCVARGISEEVANKIYDDMIDFAKYAFNKSHAAAYAVIAYQTAYLKCYYPVEFMAALLTSVIDHTSKISEYIYSCRQMGILILPPDISEGEWNFSASGNTIRYALSAIKGLGRPVIDAIIQERNANGPFADMKDFIMRLSGREVNKRTMESFIKAGAFDSLPGTRKQKMQVYVSVMDGVAQEKKRSITGQMSLFDFASDLLPDVKEYGLPDVEEYQKEELLAFEKEVLGIYISGHPLDAYSNLLKKNTTVSTLDFQIDEETKSVKVMDGAEETVGGMIIEKTLKTTRTNSIMAFLTLEDLYGTVEIIIFPRDYEDYKPLLELDKKVLIRGRAAVEEEKAAKLICRTIIPFDQIERELCIQFRDLQAYKEEEQHLFHILEPYDGNSTVCIYCKAEKARKRLPKSRNVEVTADLLAELKRVYQEENVAIIEKTIEKQYKKG